MKSFRQLRLIGATGQIRNGTFQDRPYLVVPVVALMEGVLWASNAEAPELVLASELQMAPAGWNGRPVVVNHPEILGRYVSANSPQVLEAEEFGKIFNAQAPEDRLLLEAWLDEERAEKVGVKAKEIVRRAKEHQDIGVSVGTFMTLEATQGIWRDGNKYSGIWRGIVPDHLAMLPEEVKGACSIEMGCGVLTGASAYVVMPSGLRAAKEHKMADQTLKEKFFAFFRTNFGNNELTEKELGTALSEVLKASQPCGCHDKENTMDKAARIKALIDGKKFQEADRSWLEAIPEDKLSVLEAAVTAATSPQPPANPPAQPSTPPPANPPAQPPPSTPPSTPPSSTPTGASEKTPEQKAEMTAEQFIANAPKEIQESLRDGLRANQERRAALLKTLKDSGRCQFSDDDLKNMATDQLQKLVTLSAQPVPEVSYVGAFTGPRDLADKKGVSAPPDQFAAIRASRGVKQ